MKAGWIVLILAAVLIILLNSLVYLTDFSLNNGCSLVNYINASISIELRDRNVVGLNADSQTTELKFGKISPRGTSKRSMYVTYSRDAKVKISSEGELSQWLVVTPQEIIATANNRELVMFSVAVPSDTPVGDYTGIIKFCVKE